ncbi:MAG TPA: Asp-tRNA(Asn)/Glu-tRNA(Gln) amidotransferase subunit GatC [Thermodesulfobacteriaceae bacterium]|nr:Asp-tRNA(Asn)/Glu-tRNA(Gln) amidotransferase subunit GatC [Thermodesulfobacteriaceae bacterium]
MKITRSETEHVAGLARLSFERQEIEDITGRLNEVLEYMEKLEELDTSGVEPMTHSLELTNAFRDDEVKPSLPNEEALANAPEKENQAFVVPRII